jgi:hypothetical protein
MKGVKHKILIMEDGTMLVADLNDKVYKTAEELEVDPEVKLCEIKTSTIIFASSTSSNPKRYCWIGTPYGTFRVPC